MRFEASIGRFRAGRFTACAAIVVACAAPAYAADDGAPPEGNSNVASEDSNAPTDNSPGTPDNSYEEPAAAAPHYLSLDQFDAYIELKSEFRSDKVDTRGSRRIYPDNSQKNRDARIEERVGLKLSGNVIDPSFISFGGELSIALTQSRYEERTPFLDQNDNDNGSLLLYDMRVDFFRGKKISGSVYALRQDDRIDRRFQPTLDQRRTGYGTNWILSDDRCPMELSYDYLETDRTGNTHYRDNEHFSEGNLHYTGDYIFDEHHHIKLSFEHADVVQEYQGSRGSFNTSRNLLTVEHELQFGSSYEHNFRTLMEWQDENGDFARDYFRVGPQLNLKHSENLQTSYKYQAEHESYEGFDVETHRVDATLTHQLYTNLTTTVDLFGLKENADGSVDTDQYGGLVDWQYNRGNPYGRLFANLTLAFDRQDTSSNLGRQIVVNEAQTFYDPIPVQLRNRNVIPWTVVVFDSGQRRIFRLGIDYFLIRQGNATRLFRIATGQITDRETVLIDYMYRTPADGQLDTSRVEFNLEQRFSNGLTPYYRVSFRDQDDSGSGAWLRRSERTDHHRLGVNYETKLFSLGAEYEIFDDSIEPYDGYHLNGLLRLVQTPDHSMNFSTRYSQLFFDGSGIDNHDVILIDVELDHHWQWSERWSALQRVAYRYENDTVAGVQHAWDVSAGLEYTVGDLFGELTLDYDRLSLPASEETGYGVFLRVRREINNVLARR
ncbi:MAG: hypothetical protein HY287_01460 [Planctomycetes bacterium]|nr:hypothetical protein [Planctomycetota bacterium]